MPELKGSQTHTNLKDAFAGESMANRRYLYFAKQADVEGYPEIAGNFRDTADGETGHAHGHLDYLRKVGEHTGRPGDPGYFYTKQWERSENPYDRVVIRREDYPIPAGWEPVFLRRPLVQTRFFEALYRVPGTAATG